MLALSTVLLPIALGVIMLGLGLSLALADFARVVRYPKAAFVGLFCQMAILPFACLGLAHAFALEPAPAIGLMLLAASPGGATANLYSHLANGDVALNVTLTAVNSVLSLFTLPLFVGLALDVFLGEAQSIPLPFDKILSVFAVVLAPVALGMALRSKRPALAGRLARAVRVASLALLVLIIVTSIVRAWDRLDASLTSVGLATLTFNLVSMAVGYGVPKLVAIPERQAIAISMEIAIHNAALAIALATNVLGDPAMAIPAALYSVIMSFTALGFGRLVRARAVRGAEVEPDPS